MELRSEMNSSNKRTKIVGALLSALVLVFVGVFVVKNTNNEETSLARKTQIGHVHADKSGVDKGQKKGHKKYDYGTDACQGYRQLWDPPTTPLKDRNRKGRGIWFNKHTTERALDVIYEHKFYDMGLPETTHARMNIFGIPWKLTLSCMKGIRPGRVGGCFQSLKGVAIGNTGTQFDYLSHIFYNDSRGRQIWWNNFRASDVMSPHGLKYIGVENSAPILTRIFLLDIVGARRWKIVPDRYRITVQDIKDSLAEGHHSMSDIKRGDAVYIFSNWISLVPPDLLEGGRPSRRYIRNGPRLTSAARDLLFFAGVTVIAMDMPTTSNIHGVWLVCGGGFLHESVNGTLWVHDAREGLAGYVGAYFFAPIPIRGGVGSVGRPLLYY